MSDEKYEGMFEGTKVSIFRKQYGHELTDGEIEALFRGEHITFPAVSSKGKKYNAVVHLAKDGNFYKPVMDFDYRGPMYVEEGNQIPPSSWCGHTFTDEEIETLKSGGKVSGKFHSKKSGKDFECEVEWKVGDEGGNVKRIIPSFAS